MRRRSGRHSMQRGMTRRAVSDGESRIVLSCRVLSIFWTDTEMGSIPRTPYRTICRITTWSSRNTGMAVMLAWHRHMGSEDCLSGEGDWRGRLGGSSYHACVGEEEKEEMKSCRAAASSGRVWVKQQPESSPHATQGWSSLCSYVHDGSCSHASQGDRRGSGLAPSTPPPLECREIGKQKLRRVNVTAVSVPKTTTVWESYLRLSRLLHSARHAASFHGGSKT